MKRTCKACGRPLQRKQYPNGRPETKKRWTARRHCNKQCAGITTRGTKRPDRKPPKPRARTTDGTSRTNTLNLHGELPSPTASLTRTTLARLHPTLAHAITTACAIHEDFPGYLALAVLGTPNARRIKA